MVGGGGKFDLTRGLDRNPRVMRNVDLKKLMPIVEDAPTVTSADRSSSTSAAQFAANVRELKARQPKKRGWRRFFRRGE